MAKVVFRDQEWEIPGGKTVREIIEELGLNPEAVLAVKGKKLLNEETVVEDEDEIKLIAVISGG
ncbi:MAG: MoaD/ThiS family protein [Chloroflexi bacterium]|nr:MoaD/ThiS family protein [Chloroflexota bacterium]